MILEILKIFWTNSKEINRNYWKISATFRVV